MGKEISTLSISQIENTRNQSRLILDRKARPDQIKAIPAQIKYLLLEKIKRKQFKHIPAEVKQLRITGDTPSKIIRAISADKTIQIGDFNGKLETLLEHINKFKVKKVLLGRSVAADNIPAIVQAIKKTKTVEEIEVDIHGLKPEMLEQLKKLAVSSDDFSTIEGYLLQSKLLPESNSDSFHIKITRIALKDEYIKMCAENAELRAQVVSKEVEMTDLKTQVQSAKRQRDASEADKTNKIAALEADLSKAREDQASKLAEQKLTPALKEPQQQAALQQVKLLQGMVDQVRSENIRLQSKLKESGQQLRDIEDKLKSLNSTATKSAIDLEDSTKQLTSTVAEVTVKTEPGKGKRKNSARGITKKEQAAEIKRLQTELEQKNVEIDELQKAAHVQQSTVDTPYKGVTKRLYARFFAESSSAGVTSESVSERPSSKDHVSESVVAESKSDQASEELSKKAKNDANQAPRSRGIKS